MRKAIILIFISVISLTAKTQELSNLRTKSLYYLTDTILLDSLSIITGSEIIFDKNKSVIPDSAYTIDYTKALLIPSKNLIKNESVIHVTFRVFPVNFSESFYRRKKEETIIVGPVLAKATTNQINAQNSFFFR